MPRRVTVYDVAKAANVSVATVSRVMNQNPNVAEQTRQRVLEAAAKVGFTSDGAAPNPQDMGQTIAVVIPRIATSFDALVLNGIERRASEKKLHIAVFQTHNDIASERLILRELSARGAAGAVVFSSASSVDVDGQHLKELGAGGLPVILMDQAVHGAALDMVHTDNAGGAAKAVDHLYSLGYRRIGMVGGPSGVYSSENRMRGFCAAMRSHGLDLRDEWLRIGEYSRDSGYRLTREIATLPERPEALFAANTDIAVGALDALQDLGLAVPDDMALIAFDTVNAESALYHFLTVVTQPARLMGEIAMDLLARRIAGDMSGFPAEVVLGVNLIVAKSCERKQLAM